MKIIADTNIWYKLGQDPDLYTQVKSLPISPTFANIYELSKTSNLIDKEEYTRKSIQKLFAFKADAIYEPPFIYLAQLFQEYDFDPNKEIGHWLTSTSQIAKGESVEPSKQAAFRAESEKIKAEFMRAADIVNDRALQIRKRIQNKRLHGKKDTLLQTGYFLNFVVEQSTNKKCNLYEFDLSKIELILKTLDHFFKKLETTDMKVKANDWVDFAILAYVQPGDKYWTEDRKWMNLIKEAGCEDYLFKI